VFNPDDSVQLQKLIKSLRASYRSLDKHRQKRRELIRDFTGDWSAQSDSYVEKMPVNMLALTFDVYLMYLAGNSPRVILPTFREDLMPFAANMEAVINRELEAIEFDRTLRRWVMEAMFCMGVLKCGITDSEYVEIIPGQPQPGQEYFCDVIDFDDFVFDTQAKSWDKITFIGDRYKVDYDAVRGSSDYSEEARKSLKVAEQGDVWNSDSSGGRADEIGIDARRQVSEEDVWKKTSWVWDICLPEEGLILTVADNSEDVTKPLKVVEYQGPATSPYHTLFFTDVPSSTMPLPPGQVLKSLNKAINSLYRKLIDQAKRQKTLASYREGEEVEAEKIQRAGDGELVGLSNPDSVKEIKFGGAAQENMAFAIQLSDTFSRLAGNLDALGGLGPQSETFKQDQMIHSTASQKAAKMTREVVDGTTAIIRDLAFNIWSDPYRTYRTSRRIPEFDAELEVVVEPDDRPASFEEFDVKIEPYSMSYRSPQQRANEITRVITQLVMPMMPMLQQQGIGVDSQQLFEILSKYMSLPELNQILTYQQTEGPDLQNQPSPGSPNTKRTYEHVSRPGATRQGHNQIMQQILAGGNPQESERAVLGRPTGV